MMYTVEAEREFEGCSLISASDILLECVNAVNNHRHAPYLGDRLLFTAWKEGKPAVRGYIRCDMERGPYTYEEVFCCLVEM